MDLNKACSKDPYLLSCIDQLVDSASGCDEAKTVFITNMGAFYYKMMSFSLKNIGATYQWLMDRVFKDIIGRDVEVYVDDVVVKSTTVGEHCGALRQVFDVLKKYRLKLNSKKYLLGGNQGQHQKCQAVIDMTSPRNIKEVQQLAEREILKDWRMRGGLPKDEIML
ncbi:hypothetical protein CR513_53893, partial [Mucuna pruriens]